MRRENRAANPLKKHPNQVKADPVLGVLVKKCPLCGTEYPIEEFAFVATTRERKPYCRQCLLAKGRADYAAHRQERQQRARDYAASHPEQVRERHKRWYETHQDEIMARREKTKERHNAKTKEWQQAHPERRIASDTRRKERIRNAAPSRAAKLDRKGIIARDKSTCYLCGRVLLQREITFDHVIPLVAGGKHAPDNIRVACSPCNMHKGQKVLSGARAVSSP